MAELDYPPLEAEEELHDVWRSTWGPWKGRFSGELESLVSKIDSALVFNQVSCFEKLYDVIWTVEPQRFEETYRADLAAACFRYLRTVLAGPTGLQLQGFDKSFDLLPDPVVEGVPVAERAVRFFAQAAKRDPATEAVFWTETTDTVYVWTVLDEYNREAEDVVYAAEMKALDAFRGVHLKFRILYRHGRNVDEVRPAGARRVD